MGNYNVQCIVLFVSIRTKYAYDGAKAPWTYGFFMQQTIENNLILVAQQ